MRRDRVRLPRAAHWRKSTYSGGSGGESCLEVADGVPGAVPVRDSKAAGGPVLMVGAVAWTEFMGAVDSTGERTAGDR
ncbi:DUF397 domain-containing protein [Streptomyces sp. GD-15H]|uniref:DUF397 domain-containing protein n=1 Tax=Streptomyces sp. GD-15H TaxID=3129112 RepID=UPI003872D8DD